MARSHQRGTIRLEHKSWVGYPNLKVLDPNSEESKWKKQRVGILRAKSEMTKRQAHDELKKIIAQKTGGITQPRADERIVTLDWFTRNRFFPLREGSTWKEATAETHKSAIERDILGTFGSLPLSQIDKVMLQTHLNAMAKKLSEGRVKHARFYLKAIFEEAIEQEFAARNPARKLALPNHFRTVDRTTLTSDQLRLVLASVPLRDRIVLTLDMTETFRPSELFALRWSGFDMDAHTLMVTETAYRGKLRQDQEIIAGGASSQRAGQRTVVVEAGTPRSLAGNIHLSQCAQAQRGQKERLHSHRQLPRAGAQEAGSRVGIAEAEFPGAAAHDGDAVSDQGWRQRCAGRFGTQQGRRHGERLHATDRSGREADARCDLFGADDLGKWVQAL
jgi:hypothetical protein